MPLPRSLRPHVDQLGLWLHYLLLLSLLTLTSVLTCAVAYKLFMPFSMGFPGGFFEGIATAVVIVTLLAASIEWQRLQDGGGRRVAHWLGGVRVKDDPDDVLHQRLLEIVDELVQRNSLPLPKVYALPQEDSINTVVAGWSAADQTLCVTQGALDRLTRPELTALIAHALGRMRRNPHRLAQLRLSLVWSLSWVHGQGQVLMSPRQDGRLHPLAWMAGLLLRFVGWLGWVGGRTLQAASSRAAVQWADAAAVQLTETRADLGNVLRKLWHDHQMMRGRMHHPCADMLAFLAFHDPGEMPGLATHPTLPERVQRVLGQSLPPLPSSMLPPDDTSSRRSATPTSTPGERDAGALRSPQQPFGASAESDRAASLDADRDALQRLRLRTGPTEMRLTILALMMNPGNHRENKLWLRLADDIYQPDEILRNVQRLLPTSRLPEFERLVDEVAQQPLIHKRMLVEAARDLMRADGRVSPRERLWWLVLRHRLSERANPKLMRPMTGQGQTLMDLNLMEKAYVSTLTGYVARLLPDEGPAGQISQTGQQWWRAVLGRCGDTTDLSLERAPDADALMHALSGVQELSWIVRPLLLAAWAEEALNHSPQGVLSDDTADVLRLLATLLDAPLPPMLASHYPKAA